MVNALALSQGRARVLDKVFHVLEREVLIGSHPIRQGVQDPGLLHLN